MAGIKDWLRSRSKSRSRNSQDVRREPAKPEISQPPLPLMRADSAYRKTRSQSQASTDANHTDAQSFERRRSRVRDDASVRSSQYDGLAAGPPPTIGTYPLHGNAARRFPSQSERRTSRSSGRASSSSISNFSMPRLSTSQRQSIPPSTAASASASAVPAASPLSPSRDQISSNLAHTRPTRTQAGNNSSYRPDDSSSANGYSKKGKTPLTPIVPKDHNETTSTPPSRTPIAEQFTHSRPPWFDPPTTSSSETPPIVGIQSQKRTDSLSSQKHTLKHQPDIDDLNSKMANEHPVGIPQRQSSLAYRQDVNDSRGRPGRQSMERVLPIPKELENAPWNRPDLFLGDKTPRSEDSSSSSEVDAMAERIAPLTINKETKAVDESQHGTARPVGVSRTQYSRNHHYSSSGRMASSREENVIIRNAPALAAIREGPQRVYQNPLDIENASQPASLEGIVDLTNTEDTSVHTRYASAVTHETVKPLVHHIREERITREIHTHEVHHRILPIVDVQVLPAKHYVPTGNGDELVEIPAEQVPGRALDAHNNRNWVIAETVSKALAPESKVTMEPRQFTARNFEGTEGDYEEWVGEDGIPRSKTTWVHPPTIDEEAMKRGLTVPLEMD